MSFILPITPPIQQLPDPAQKLSNKFIQAFSRPAGLWTPSTLALAAADFSGNRNTGTLNGGVTLSANAPPGMGSSWYTRGAPNVNIGIVFPAAVIANTSNTPFSFGGWFTWDIVSGTANAINISGTSNDIAITTRSGGTIRADIQGGTVLVDSGFTPSVGVWYFCFFTFNGTTSTIYVLGSGVSHIVSGTPSVPATDITKLTMGEWKMGTSVFDERAGLTASGMFYLSALTLSQVSALYSSLRTGEPFPIFEPSAYERFVGSVVAAAGGGPFPWFLDNEMSGGFQSLGGF